MKRRQLLISGLAVGAGILLARTGVAAQSQNALAAHLDGLAAKKAFPGYAAALWHDGQSQAAHGGTLSVDGPAVSADSLFRVASLTKPITAATALSMVEDGLIGLDDSVESVLPELAGMMVVADIAGPVENVVKAERPLTLRHLLTNTSGLGLIMQWPPTYPLQQATADAGIAPGATFFTGSHDDYVAAVAKVPLAAQPGEGFFYGSSFDLAGVLIARLAGKSLADAVTERILAPLGMTSTFFVVPESERSRIATLYIPDMESGAVGTLEDPSLALDESIAFQSAAGGLASTAGDLLRFGRMLLGRGELEGTRVLSEASVEAMFTDQLTDAQRASPHAAGVLGGGLTWGLGGAVSLGGGEMNLPAGSFGWNGGYGTSLWVDPANNLTGVLLTNQVVMSALPAEPLIGFWKLAYQTAGIDQG